jgi:short-subunit dehydrogenase
MTNFYNNKVIWITGSSSGIGKGLVDVLSHYSVTLVISARRISELQKVFNEFKNRNAKIHILAFDLLDINDFKEHTAAIIEQFGRIDILFNNGGISQRSLAIETPLQVDRKLMEVNFFANIQLAKCVLPFMLSQKSGIIAVTSSISGKFGYYQRSSYAASKHALHGYYESLYLENRMQGIKVIMICPGSIKTDISYNAINKEGQPTGFREERLEKGMDAVVCAKKIISAVAKNKKEVLIGKKELIPVYLKKFFPSLFWRIIQSVKP